MFRWCEAAIVVLAVAAAFVAVTVQPARSARETGRSHTDPSEGAPVDIVAASVGQQDGELVLRLQMASPIVPSDFASAGGGRTCFTLHSHGGGTSLPCVTHDKGRWLLRAGARSLPGAVEVSPADVLTVRATAHDLWIKPGVLDWSASTQAAACTPSVTVAACSDLAPDQGTFTGRVWRVVLTGCKARGKKQVTNGPRVKRIALTYDDGPSSYTAGFLRVLRRNHVHATFFMLGNQVASRSRIVRRAFADGNEIGNHSWDHSNLGGGGPQATNQMKRTQAAIKHATGYTPCVFRPPYGTTGADLRARVRALGMTDVLWSVDPNDWKLPGTDAIISAPRQVGQTGAAVSRVLSGTRPGAIILDHDGGGNRAQTFAAAATIIKKLHARGYEFVTVSTLLGYAPVYTLRR